MESLRIVLNNVQYIKIYVYFQLKINVEIVRNQDIASEEL